MKLKKIVSLALAGVMAVSMLAGCATGKKPGTGEGEGEGTAAGYSAKFGEYVDTKLDYVTFADNATDAAALQSMVDNYSDSDLSLSTTGLGWVNANGVGVADFKKDADLDEYTIGSFMENNSTTNMNVTYKIGSVYIADGTVSLDKALKAAAEDVKARLTSETSMPEQGVNNTVYYDYSYVVSVSVVNRSTTTSSMVTVMRSFIAVTITRTGTPAKV